MKVLKNSLSLFLTASIFTIVAYASQPQNETGIKTDQVKLSEMQKSKLQTLIPETEESIAIGQRELDSAIAAYGIQRYIEVLPEYNTLYNAFLGNPNEQTKNELMTFLKANEMFAQIVKPVPDSLFNSAKAKGVIITGYDGAEHDYAKIEAYLDEK